MAASFFAQARAASLRPASRLTVTSANKVSRSVGCRSVARFQRFDGVVGPAGRVEGDGVDIGVSRVAGIDLGGAPDLLQRVGRAPLADEIEPERMMQIGIVRHPGQRLAQHALAVGIPALLRVDLRQTDIAGRKAGIEGAGGGKLRLGLGKPPLLRKKVAEVDPVLGPIGVDPLRRDVFVDARASRCPVVRRQCDRSAWKTSSAAASIRTARTGSVNSGLASGQLCSGGNGRNVRRAARRTSGSASASPRSAAATVWRLG